MNLHVFREKPTFIPGPADVKENRFWCLLCYLGFLFIIPYLMKPNSRFVRYHANQGLILFILEMAVGIVINITGVVFSFFFLWIIPFLLSFVASAVFLIWIVYGIISVLRGYVRPLPVIGDVFVFFRYDR